MTEDFLCSFLKAVAMGDLGAVISRFAPVYTGTAGQVNFQHPDSGNSALILAAEGNHPEVVAFLLGHGADVTLCNYNNQTALHVANGEIQRLLLSAIKRASFPHLQMPQAAWQGDLEVLQHLLATEQSLDINEQNQQGLTPLMLAVRDIDLFERLLLVTEYRPLAVIQELLKHNADPRLCDFSGKSAACYLSGLRSPRGQQLTDALALGVSTSDTQERAATDSCPNTETHLLDSAQSAGDQDGLTPGSCTHRTQVCLGEEGIHDLELSTEDIRPEPKIILDFQKASGSLGAIEKEYKDCESSLPRLWATASLSNNEAMTFQTKRHPSLPPFPQKRDEHTTQLRRLGLGYLVQGSRSEPNISQAHLGTDSLRDIKEIKQHIIKRLSSAESTRKVVPHLCQSPRTGRLIPLEINKTRNTDRNIIACTRQSLLPSSYNLPKSADPVFRDFLIQEKSPEIYKAEEPVLSQDLICISVDNIDISSEGLKKNCNEKTLNNERAMRDLISDNDQNVQTLRNKNGKSLNLYQKDETPQGTTKGAKEDITGEPEYHNHLTIQIHNDNDLMTNYIVMQQEGGISNDLMQKKTEEKDTSDKMYNCQYETEEEGLDTGKVNQESPKESKNWLTGSIECDSSRTPRNMALPLVHITFSEQESQKELNTSPIKQFIFKRKTLICGVPHSVNHSFNIIAQNDDKTKKTKKNRNKSAPEPSMKHKQRPFSNKKVHLNGVLCPSIGFSGSPMHSRPPKKGHGIETKGLDKSGQRCQTELSMSTDKKIHSPTKVHSIHRVNTAPDFSGLNYSDMFTEIEPQKQGPGIFQMFETPVYSIAKDENDCTRDVNLASSNKNFATKGSRCTSSSGSTRSRSQKRPNSRNKKTTTTGSHQKRKNSSTKERAKNHVENNVEQDNVIIISGTDWQIKTESQDVTHNEQYSGFQECEILELNQHINHSDLSIIKEATLEGSIVINEISTIKNIMKFREMGNNADNVEGVPPESVEPTLKMPSIENEVGQQNIYQEDNFDEYYDGDVDHFQIMETNNLSKGPSNVISSSENQQLCEDKITKTEFLDNRNEDTLYSQQERLTPCNSNSDGIYIDSKKTSEDISTSVDSEHLTENMIISLIEQLISIEENDSKNYQSTENSRTEEQDINIHKDNFAGHDRQMPSPRENDRSTSQNSNYKEDDFDHSQNISQFNLNNDGSITWTKGEVLGKGAYGTVYCGLTTQGELIAAKQVIFNASEPATAEKEYKKLQEEVDLLKALEHVNIVGYLGTNLQDNTVTIFMEFVPGGSISSVLRRFGPLPEMVFVKYTKQILQGISYLHNNRVIHRDIKGNNIMLMPNGVIKLIDFGCAKRLTYVSMSGTQSEMLKSMHGTPYWMAPEVINESGHGKKSDIWSTGCTVFEMATGKPPLAHMNKMAAMFYIGAQRGLMPTLPDHFSKKARDFVNLCLNRDQHERPDAEQLLQHPFIKRKL
ncbi:LOW QUALITY PROTEIN: mitogen-activated protein kinase kinase kinase 19 [Discoglossus pictus]